MRSLVAEIRNEHEDLPVRWTHCSRFGRVTRLAYRSVRHREVSRSLFVWSLAKPRRPRAKRQEAIAAYDERFARREPRLRFPRYSFVRNHGRATPRYFLKALLVPEILAPVIHAFSPSPFRLAPHRGRERSRVEHTSAIERREMKSKRGRRMNSYSIPRNVLLLEHLSSSVGLLADARP